MFHDDFRLSYTYWDACCTSDGYDRPYADQLPKDGYGRPYVHQLPHSEVKDSCLSGGYLRPQWTSDTTETTNYLDSAPVDASSTSSSQTGSAISRDTHAQECNTENRRLSNRFFPKLFVNEKNYPNIANAPNQRISQWLSSDACGIKKFGGFISPSHQQNWKS